MTRLAADHVISAEVRIEETLYVNSRWTRELVGVDPEEGEPLLMYLCAQAAVPEYQCRLNWQPFGLAICDDYALQHYAVGDYTEGQSFWRTTIRGENPNAPVISAQEEG